MLVLPAVKGARVAPAARETQRALEQGLGARAMGRWSVLRRALLEEGQRAVAAGAAGRADAVAAAIAAARKDYVAQQFGEMKRRLLAVEASSLAQLARPEGRAQAVLLNQLLAIAALSAGEQPVADARFRLMLALDAKADIDAGLYPPKVVAYFAQVRADVARLSPTTVSLTTTPDDVELVVDGRARASSESLALRPGLHYLRVRALGYADEARRLEVKGGGGANAETIKLAALGDAAARRRQLARAIAEGSVDARVPAVRRAIAHALGAAGILFWSSLADGRLRVGFTSSPEVADRAAKNMPAAAATRAWDVVVLGKPLDPNRGRGDGKRARGAPFYKRWWFWTIAGAVVAGAVTATVLATQLGGDTFGTRFGNGVQP
ncbi:MAG: hypothetical protein KC503_35755 [Myxococcales bacterium]|nr:hypothetical protein [Myxococcales bacterium]